MKRSHKFVITCMTVCLAGAVTLRAEDRLNKDEKSQTSRETERETQYGAGKQTSDIRFLEDAAKGGIAEVKVAELGTQKAQSESVKQFAQKLQTDHQKANEKIQDLCNQKSVTKATDIEQEHQKTIDHLSSLSGEEFDKMFIEHMVKDHKKDIKKFEKESERGEDPAIRSFASEILPTLKEHLRIAQALQENPNASLPELKEPAGAEIKSSTQPQGSSSQQNQNTQPDQSGSQQQQPQQNQDQPKSNP